MLSKGKGYIIALLVLGLCVEIPGLAEDTTLTNPDANAVFSQYGLNVIGLRLQEEYVLPDTLQYNQTQEETFYWAYVNELLSSDGMTLANHLSQRITASMYDTDMDSTKAVVLSCDGKTIGAYRIKRDGLFTTDDRSFEEATGKSMLTWLSENGNTFAVRFIDATQDAQKTAELYFEASIAKDWIVTTMLISENHVKKRMSSLDEMNIISQPPPYMLAQSNTVVEIISMEEIYKGSQLSDERYFQYFAEFSSDNGDGNRRQMIAILCLTDDGWRVDRFATGL